MYMYMFFQDYIIIDDKINEDDDDAVFIIGELCLEFRATPEVDSPF